MTTKSTDYKSPAGMAVLPNTKYGLTAAGSSQGTALVIPVGQDLSVITTCAASAGVILPATGPSISEDYVVINHGANPLTVYPGSGGQIGTLGANVGLSIAAGKGATLWWVGVNQWAYNNSA